MTRAETIEKLRMISRHLEVAPRRMTSDGGAIKALIPVKLVSAIDYAIAFLEEPAPERIEEHQ